MKTYCVWSGELQAALERFELEDDICDTCAECGCREADFDGVVCQICADGNWPRVRTVL